MTQKPTTLLSISLLAIVLATAVCFMNKAATNNLLAYALYAVIAAIAISRAKSRASSTR